MSTRCTIDFTDEYQTVTIYKHCDGYPEGEHGIIALLQKAQEFAWPLPRFEADEYSAAFVVAAKAHAGNVRIFKPKDRAGDSAYLYKVRMTRGKLVADVFSYNGWDESAIEKKINTVTLWSKS